MSAAVELVSEDERETERDTYGDPVAPFEVSHHEVSILVDGRPGPQDEPVDEDVDHVRVLWLIRRG